MLPTQFGLGLRYPCEHHCARALQGLARDTQQDGEMLGRSLHRVEALDGAQMERLTRLITICSTRMCTDSKRRLRAQRQGGRRFTYSRGALKLTLIVILTLLVTLPTGM